MGTSGAGVRSCPTFARRAVARDPGAAQLRRTRSAESAHRWLARGQGRGRGPEHRRGPASRPALAQFVVLLVCDALGSSLRRSRCGGRLVGRPAHAPARARPQNIRRTSHQAVTLAASPKPTSVTHVQRGGSASSVEPVDGIGSSFPLEATSGAPVATFSLQVSALPRAV